MERVTTSCDAGDCKVSPATWQMLRLSMLPGIGPRTLSLLLDGFGDPAAVFAASDHQLASVRGVGPKVIAAIRKPDAHVDVDLIVQWCARNGVDIICQDDDGYPKSMTDLVDAPPILFVRGDVLAEDELSVAIVGTRHATTYGLKYAEQFAHGLARAGVTVISGLARGIDAAAHKGALAGGGRTIAVLGSGHCQMYFVRADLRHQGTSECPVPGRAPVVLHRAARLDGATTV